MLKNYQDVKKTTMFKKNDQDVQAPKWKLMQDIINAGWPGRKGSSCKARLQPLFVTFSCH